jgi:hypothetical protein
MRSYGWEQSQRLFNIAKYKIELLKELGVARSNIIWGDKIKSLIDSTEKSNSLFA